MPSSLKRRQASPGLSDSENVDPQLQKLSAKRKRSSEDEDDVFQPAKAPINAITLTAKPRHCLSALSSAHTVTPKITSSKQISVTPASAPAAAGRSPTSSKRVGILSRSRRGLGRMDPASLGAKSRSNAPSLSLAAALNGTMAYSKPAAKPLKHVRTLEESTPKSWMFDIHEDTPEEEMVNLMGHSTCTLDLSDDESKSRIVNDRGKENVPPLDMAAVITAPPASRRDAMTDEPRTPLGDLAAEDFYAEGCDANSHVTIAGEDAPLDKPVTSSIDNILAGSSKLCNEFTVEAPSSSSTLLRKAELDALIYGIEPPKHEPEACNALDDNEDAATDIEIWESGSTQEDSESCEVVESIFAV